ncbi:hypothetical protein JVU11DRAFT_2473 [Chiua virens]|nr:hypothetical protein JVU11DRAFT_2473 [Chiua virens]
MTSANPHVGAITVASTVTLRRKPALTYQSPVQSTSVLHLETSLFTSESATTLLLPPSPPTQLSQIPELSQRSTITHKPSRHYMTNPLLPLYHPFGTLALSLPDLDPTAFGLPAPVAVFDDPTRRSSNRQRRPAAKVRDVDDPAPPQPPSFGVTPPILEPEVREKSSPRRRRGGGPGGKRKRRETEDGDATYPAKRSRNPRSSGATGARGLSREEGSPALSNAHTGASPALDAGRGDVVEEKKRERRTTRSRGVIVRRDSTASEETVTSGSASGSATNTGAARVVSSGEPTETEEHVANDGLNEAATAPGSEAKKVDVEDKPAAEQ